MPNSSASVHLAKDEKFKYSEEHPILDERKIDWSFQFGRLVTSSTDLRGKRDTEGGPT